MGNRFAGLPRLAVLAQRCGVALPLDPAVAERDVQVFRALGDPTRLQIVALLAAQSEPLCVCYVEAAFALTQPTISHHLKVLRDANLVTTERRGVWIYYQLNQERLREAAQFFDELRAPPAGGDQGPFPGTPDASAAVCCPPTPASGWPSGAEREGNP